MPSCFVSALVFLSHNKNSRLNILQNNVIKITLITDQQWHNENVSDAVILKPLKIVKDPITLHLKEGSVLLEKRIDVTVFASCQLSGFLLPLANDEMIFGGGERALPLNRRGYRLNLYNNPWYGYGEGADNLNYSVPFITSSKGYGLFFDNPSKVILILEKQTMKFWSTVHHRARSMCISFSEIINKYFNRIINSQEHNLFLRDGLLEI